ncbi:MAG: hypothetical protein ACFFDP_10820 [Promethearchaeota archaeon]
MSKEKVKTEKKYEEMLLENSLVHLENLNKNKIHYEHKETEYRMKTKYSFWIHIIVWSILFIIFVVSLYELLLGILIGFYISYTIGVSVFNRLMARKYKQLVKSTQESIIITVNRITGLQEKIHG